ncbi:MAG: hypothetical protein H0U13_02485 [Gemmatimonadaceae bacterium]|nr:hypothetical protein [Gemmatimonadaceae bacterium]
MRVLGESAASPGRIYFTGGVSALLMQWRATTVDIDIKMVPDQDSLFRALPSLKESLEMNIELAAPDQFIPALDGWQDRSIFIVQEGRLSFHHYDFYSQALAKIERGHDRDLGDVNAMLDLGLVERAKCIEYFDRIEPELYQFPAIDPPSFRQAVERVMQSDSRES